MKLAFIVDPLASFNLKKDTTYAMMVEAAARGHTLYAFQQDDLAWHKHQVSAHAAELQLTGSTPDWFHLQPATTIVLSDFDAVIMRKDPPFDMEYIYSTYLLELAERGGARIFNRPQAIRDFNEKMAIARFAEFTAPSLVTRKLDWLQDFIDSHTDVILKPLDGMGGASIFRVGATDPNRNVILETLTAHGQRTIMAQRYIPEIRDGDKRILLIAGKPVPFSLARIPKAGESRGNLAAGGTGVTRPLSQRDLQIANKLGPVLAERGLLLVGLDVIGDYLTEVNCTSPTCFREITDQTGFNVAGMFMDALESACVGGK